MATITVGPSGRDYTSPQAAINAADAGDVIVLDSGVTFTESLILPPDIMSPPVVIKSSAAAPNRRVVASDLSDMAVLRPFYLSEACVTGDGVNGWEFEFICFDSPGGYFNHVYLNNVNLGGGSFRNSQNIIFDRILIIGSNPNSTRTGLYLNGGHMTITRSHIANIHKAGEESKAIVLQEGPGPFTITDNFLESASVGVLFGGGDTQSAAHIPDNILIEGNHFYKNPAWEGGPYAIKNIFELKTAKHVTVRNNLLENNWSGAQDGYGILFQPVNDTASSPWNVIEDVLFDHNTVISECGINILGYEWQPAYNSGQCTRVTFRNNLWTVENDFIKASGEVGELTIEHDTINNGGYIGRFSAGWIHPAGESFRAATCAIEEFTFQNNLLYANGGLIGEGTAAGMDTLTTFCPTGLTWTHNVLANKTGGESYPSVTTHPSTATHQANFVDLVDFQLTGGSGYRGAGNDTLDLGWTGFENSSGAASASGSCTVLGVSTAEATGIAIGTAINNGAYVVEDSSLSWLFNAEGHPLLVTVRGDYAVDDVTGVTYFGVPGTLLGKVAVAGARWTYLYGWLTPAAGTNTVIVTATSGHYLFGCAVSYRSVVAFGSVVTATQGTPNTAFAISLTTALVNSWVAAAIGSEEANFGAGSGTTLRSRFTTFLDPGFVDNNAAVPASTNVTLNVNTSSANRWVGIAVELIAGATFPSSQATATGMSTASAGGGAISSGTGIATASSTATGVLIGSTDHGDIVPVTFTIGGVPQGVRSGTLRINESLNARNVLGCEVVSLNGTYRPADGAEVMYTVGVDRVFGGLIDLPTERGLVNQMGTRLVNGVNTVDFNSFADRRHINGIIPAGSLKAALQVIVPYLSDYGVTLDPLQVDGPAVPLLYLPTRLIRDVFDELSVMTGYAWEIDYHRVLRMFMPGSIAAPFNVIPNSDPSVITGDITVETVRTDYANRIILLAGSGILETTQAFVGDGTTRVFPLRVAVTGVPGTVTVNVVPVTVGTHGVDTAFEWTVRYSDNAIVQLAEAPPGTAHSPLTGSDTLSVVYAGQYPYQVVANDLAAQAPPRGVWEKVYQADKTFEPDAAQALADGYLLKHVTSFQGVRYPTRRRGLKPGQTQTITAPQRNLSGTFLITDIETSDTADQQFQYVVRAVGGTVIPPSWRDFFRQGGGVTGGSATPVQGGGGGGAGVTVGQTFYLGGSRNTTSAPPVVEWRPVPDWVPHAARAGFPGRVRAECWAREAGTSVQLRLRRRELNPQWTDATTAAASPVVTSTIPTEVTFDAAITAGKTYRLELISSVNASGVYGIGSLESL